MSQIAEIIINNVKVAVRHDDDAGVFVGFCPNFQVYSQAETKDDAIAAVNSAVCLRLLTAFDHGTFHTILRQAGFERIAPGVSQRPCPDESFIEVHFKEGAEVSEMDIRVPIGALLQQSTIEQCPH